MSHIYPWAWAVIAVVAVLSVFQVLWMAHAIWVAENCQQIAGILVCR